MQKGPHLSIIKSRPFFYYQITTSDQTENERPEMTETILFNHVKTFIWFKLKVFVGLTFHLLT